MSRKLLFLIISLLHGAGLALSYLLFPGMAIWVKLVLLALIIGTLLVTLAKNYEAPSIYIAKFGYISIYLLFTFLFLNYFPALSVYLVIFYILGVALSVYFLLLATNVYIVTERRGDIIPLLQPAKVITFVSFVATIFLAATVIYKLLWFDGSPYMNLSVKLVAFILFYSVLFLSSKWFFISEGVGTGPLNSTELKLLNRISLFGIVVLSQISFVLMFFPFEAYGRAVILGAVGYFINSFTQSYLSHRINTKLIVEFMVALIFVYILIYFT